MNNKLIVLEVPTHFDFAAGLKFDPRKVYSYALRLFMREFDSDRFIEKLADEVSDNIRRYQHDTLRLGSDDDPKFSIHDEFRVCSDFILGPVAQCIYGLYDTFGIFNIISISNFGHRCLLLELVIKEDDRDDVLYGDW